MNLLDELPLSDGDVVLTEADPGARYRVVAVYESKAWIRGVDHEREMIIEHALCSRPRTLH